MSIYINLDDRVFCEDWKTAQALIKGVKLHDWAKQEGRGRNYGQLAYERAIDFLKDMKKTVDKRSEGKITPCYVMPKLDEMEDLESTVIESRTEIINGKTCIIIESKMNYE